MNILEVYKNEGENFIADERILCVEWKSDMELELHLVFSLEVPSKSDKNFLITLRNIALTKAMEIDQQVYAMHKFFEISAIVFNFSNRNLKNLTQVPSMFYEVTKKMDSLRVNLFMIHKDLLYPTFNESLLTLYNYHYFEMKMLYLIKGAKLHTEDLTNNYPLTEVPEEILDTLIHYQDRTILEVTNASIQVFETLKLNKLSSTDNFQYRFSYFLIDYVRRYFRDQSIIKNLINFFYDMDHNFFIPNHYYMMATVYYEFCYYMYIFSDRKCFNRLSLNEIKKLESQYYVTKRQAYIYSQKFEDEEENRDQYLLSLSNKIQENLRQRTLNEQNKYEIATKLKCLQEILSKVSPGSHLKIYGSCTLETWTQYSDININIAIDSIDCLYDELRTNESLLVSYSGSSKLAVKFQDLDSSFILSLNHEDGILRTESIHKYLSNNMKAVYLILYIKLWAKDNAIYGDGYLAGFHITLLVIFLFEHIRSIEHSEPNEKSTGLLALYFFEFFSKHHENNKVFNIREKTIEAIECRLFYAVRDPVLGEIIGVPEDKGIHSCIQEGYVSIMERRHLIN